MNKKGLNLWLLLTGMLVSTACMEQKVLVTGHVYNKTDNQAEGLEVKLHRDKEIKQNRQYKRTAVQPDGSFQMKAKRDRSYILEINGEQGSGRVFLPAEKLQERIDASYPVTEKIVFLHTNDKHFDVNHEDEFAQKLEEIRAEYDDVFLLEAGDIFVRHAHRWVVNGGLAKDTAWYGERALQLIQSMNKLDYDVMTLGNHELAYMNDYTRIALEAARFPVLAANIEISTDKLPQPDPFTVLNTKTKRRIAVLGLATDNAGREGVKELDLAETVNKYKSLKDFSDVFLVLSHLGLRKDSLLAGEFPVFDAIIGGHSHDLLEEAVIENSVLIAHAGGNPHFVSDEHPLYLGKVVLTLENGKITDKRGRVMEIGRKAESEIKMPERGLCAHRGAMETHPENTIPAFREAVKAGAYMIEFDVQLTKDKKLVVMHDATVDRTTNGTGKVSELTLAEIKQLDAGSWKSPEFKGLQVPTFREVLDEMPVNVWLNIHLKGTGEAPQMIAEILKEENRLHQAFLACGSKAAKQARGVVPNILICNMDRRESNGDYVSGTIEMDADFIQLRGAITPEFAEYAKTLKENGIRINYYGTDSPDEIKMLFDYGVEFPLVNDILTNISVPKEIGIEPVKPVFR
ncbi:MAG: metallophosphoesterase [Mariniphaga sp.]|nr:metallophosphoesterase [Mariniphaga sp.]